MQTGDIKLGQTFRFDGKIWTAIEWQHVCQPRLAAFIRARIKNVETGAVLERNFKTNENVELCQIEEKRCNIFIMIMAFIISWIWKHMTNFHSRKHKLKMQ